MIVKPYVYKALREELKTHDNGKIQNLRGFGSLSLRLVIMRELVTETIYNNNEIQLIHHTIKEGGTVTNEYHEVITPNGVFIDNKLLVTSILFLKLNENILNILNDPLSH